MTAKTKINRKDFGLVWGLGVEATQMVVSELVDLKLVGCVFRAAGRLVGTAAAGAAMGHPAAAVAWLVNTLGQRGQYLRAGSVVLSGGLTASVPLRTGAVVSAEFDGLGSVHAFAGGLA